MFLNAWTMNKHALIWAVNALLHLWAIALKETFIDFFQ